MVNMIIIINMEEGVIIGTETEIGTEIEIEIGTEIGTEIGGGDADMEVVAVKVVEGVAEDVEDLVARAEVVMTYESQFALISIHIATYLNVFF